MKRRAAARAKKTFTDDRIATRREFPRARQAHCGTCFQIERCNRVIFDFVRAGEYWLALGEKTARHACDFWGPQIPKCDVDEMNAQIDNTTAARKISVIEPWFVGPVGVMEHQIDREDVAQL